MRAVVTAHCTAALESPNADMLEAVALVLMYLPDPDAALVARVIDRWRSHAGQ